MTYSLMASGSKKDPLVELNWSTTKICWQTRCRKTTVDDWQHASTTSIPADKVGQGFSTPFVRNSCCITGPDFPVTLVFHQVLIAIRFRKVEAQSTCEEKDKTFFCGTFDGLLFPLLIYLSSCPQAICVTVLNTAKTSHYRKSVASSKQLSEFSTVEELLKTLLKLHSFAARERQLMDEHYANKSSRIA